MKDSNSKDNRKEEKEKAMKMTTLVKASVFTAALGLASLLPTTARAQAEVSPDFFELSNTAPVAQPTQVAANISNADFHGTFSLPYDAKCTGGKNLKSGQYTLLVKSDGANRVVTLRRGAEQMNFRVRRALGNSTASQSAVLVRKLGEKRVLQAVYLDKLNALLLLDDVAEGSLARMERLPIY